MARLSALRTGRLYLQEILLVLVSVRGLVDTRAIVRPEEVIQSKITMAPSGIEHTTFRTVVQCPIQTLHRVYPMQGQNIKLCQNRCLPHPL
jgi:hypothetical protein